ncbi:hypothetical protein C8J56DRAFT_884376 [Mycena floridula]|nr:hypothetical protein C8J56DRAFT_884376 [Mycena floridula]
MTEEKNSLKVTASNHLGPPYCSRYSMTSSQNITSCDSEAILSLISDAEQEVARSSDKISCDKISRLRRFVASAFKEQASARQAQPHHESPFTEVNQFSTLPTISKASKASMVVDGIRSFAWPSKDRKACGWGESSSEAHCIPCWADCLQVYSAVIPELDDPHFKAAASRSKSSSRCQPFQATPFWVVHSGYPNTIPAAMAIIEDDCTIIPVG